MLFQSGYSLPDTLAQASFGRISFLALKYVFGQAFCRTEGSYSHDILLRCHSAALAILLIACSLTFLRPFDRRQYQWHDFGLRP